MTNTRHKKPNKRSLAAKKRWAKAKGLKPIPYEDLFKKPNFKVGDTLRIKLPNDYIVKDVVGNDATDKFQSLLNTSAQTRLDIIFHDLEQAMKEVVAKLKAMF